MKYCVKQPKIVQWLKDTFIMNSDEDIWRTQYFPVRSVLWKKRTDGKQIRGQTSVL